MTYVPPSGWIEPTDEHSDEQSQVDARFHSRTDCERVKSPGGLVQVHKVPYLATRCPGCAHE